MADPLIRLDIAASEQCLRNSDVLEEILDHLSSTSDPGDLAITRQSLLWIASTCRFLSPSAVKFLWRKLDNIIPLLFLLPSFAVRGGIYGLFGTMEAQDWGAFDRHAAFVKEISYENRRHIHIDPSVYVRLALRPTPVLPNLARLECGDTETFVAAEAVLYMQSPLQTIELAGGDQMPNTTASMFTSMTLSSIYGSATVIHLSILILDNQPFDILSEGISLTKLTSLELRRMKGNMSTALFRRIGSIRNLRSFTADTECLRAALANPFDSGRLVPMSELFMELTHLHLNATQTSNSPILLLNFLRDIGTRNLRSLVLRRMAALPASVPIPIRGATRGRGFRGSAVVRFPGSRVGQGYIHTIAHRWSRSLRRLDFDFSYLHEEELTPVNTLKSLRSLTFSGRLSPLDSPPHSSLCTKLCAELPELEFLSLGLEWHPATWGSLLRPPYVAPSIVDLFCLAEKCKGLQEIELPILTNALPPVSSTPAISHGLRKINVRSTKTPPDTLGLARHLDRLFPRLNSVVCAEGGTEEKAAWAHVQNLVFVFQDVRRTALAQR
ncbi:hypothetical protein DFH07DRAFT_942963 [Mycena maculata]|uniref:Uncharacterized protein n=1 Tax=Mycena maculata TaxID=230809 RepID=A0AAD7IL83_9AGAR|nr:hypothetical protein DFH07DRAFT_942963 [Mycena maculata]